MKVPWKKVSPTGSRKRWRLLPGQRRDAATGGRAGLPASLRSRDFREGRGLALPAKTHLLLLSSPRVDLLLLPLGHGGRRGPGSAVAGESPRRAAPHLPALGRPSPGPRPGPPDPGDRSEVLSRTRLRRTGLSGRGVGERELGTPGCGRQEGTCQPSFFWGGVLIGLQGSPDCLGKKSQKETVFLDKERV